MTVRSRMVWASALGVLSLAIGGAAQAASGLPDGRGYERVTPADKNDSDPAIISGSVAAYAALNGERVLFTSTAALAGTSSGFGGAYVASRTPDGWVTKSATPPEAAGKYMYSVWEVNDDLSRVSVRAEQGDIWNAAHLPFSFGVGPVGGPYSMLATVPPGPHGSDTPVGTDADLQHLVMQIDNGTSMSPQAPDLVHGPMLYEGVVGGDVRIVNIAPDGTLLKCGAVLGNGTGSISIFGQINTVSADGSKIFFRSPSPDVALSDPSCGTSRLYVRENRETTVEVSAPQGFADPSGQYSVQFAGAPSDGSAVYFLTRERLTPDVVGNEIHLYQYSFATHALTHISGGPDGTAAGAVGIALVSNDGSTVYLTSHSQLVPGEGTDGEPNLYRYDVASGEYHYITTLSSGDELDISFYDQPNATRPLYTTPDGRFLEFRSNQDLTPDSPAGVSELYRYSAASGAVDCISCPPPGVTPTSDSEFVSFNITNRYVPGLSDDGSTALFDTSAPLVDADGNTVRDVYEWHDGAVHLISSGADSQDSFALGVSANGRDLFFATHARMVPEDRDDFADVYDARIGGGFAASPAKASCASDDCQGPPSPAPGVVAPASEGIFGPGNLTPGPASISVKRTLAVKRISAAQRARFARTGRLSLTLKVSAAGRASAQARAWLGGQFRTVAKTSRAFPDAGVGHLELRLSKAALQALRDGRRLRVAITVRFTGTRAQTATLTLSRRHG